MIEKLIFSSSEYMSYCSNCIKVVFGPINGEICLVLVGLYNKDKVLYSKTKLFFRIFTVDFLLFLVPSKRSNPAG